MIRIILRYKCPFHALIVIYEINIKKVFLKLIPPFSYDVLFNTDLFSSDHLYILIHGRFFFQSCACLKDFMYSSL